MKTRDYTSSCMLMSVLVLILGLIASPIASAGYVGVEFTNDSPDKVSVTVCHANSTAGLHKNCTMRLSNVESGRTVGIGSTDWVNVGLTDYWLMETKRYDPKTGITYCKSTQMWSVCNASNENTVRFSSRWNLETGTPRLYITVYDKGEVVNQCSADMYQGCL